MCFFVFSCLLSKKTCKSTVFIDFLQSNNENYWFLKKRTNHFLINIGSGEEKTIKNYADFIMKKLGIKLKIRYDKRKPNGTPRKKIDCKLAKTYGWNSKFNLEQGFKITYKDFLLDI